MKLKKCKIFYLQLTTSINTTLNTQKTKLNQLILKKLNLKNQYLTNQYLIQLITEKHHK